VRIIFNHLERKRQHRPGFSLSSLSPSPSSFFLSLRSFLFLSPTLLAVRVASRATGTGFRGIFFFRPRFLGGDLMELKSFRDAHRCALLLPRGGGCGGGARDSRRKNSSRAKKESSDR